MSNSSVSVEKLKNKRPSSRMCVTNELKFVYLSVLLFFSIFFLAHFAVKAVAQGDYARAGPSGPGAYSCTCRMRQDGA